MKYLLLFCFGLSALIIIYELLFSSTTFSYLQKDQSVTKLIKEIMSDSNAAKEMELFSKCKLTEFNKDGWTNDLLEMQNVDENPIKNCDDTFTTFTVLNEDGTVTLNTSKKGVDRVKCEARSVYWQSEKSVNSSSWITVESKSPKVFDSDFVETRCMNLNNKMEIVEMHIHVQMWNAKDKKRPYNETTEEKPDVLIFVLDSVSNNQVRRSLPKTIALLEHELEAVNMRHLNKVGENSLPNGVAFLLGKLATYVDKGIFGMGKEKAERDMDTLCSEYVDEEPFILKEFGKKGYKSFMAEDWGFLIFSCKGFRNLPATHYMRPFYVRYDKEKQLREFMGTKQCFEHHTFLLNYMRKFFESYKESPKISLLWAAKLAHDNPDHLFHIDAQLFNYFREHRQLLDKSYVFFMADHGARFGNTRKSTIGDLETSNPLLFVSVPKHLRERLNPILRENSNQLITPFEIYASLIDIANDPQSIGDMGPLDSRGKSFLRPLSGERSCRTLPIPIEFCTCEWNKTKSHHYDVNKAIGVGTVEVLNKLMEDLRIVDRCKEFTLKEVKEVKLIDGSNGLAEIKFTANECSAEFKSIVRIREMESGRLNVTRGSDDFARINAYGNTASCINDRPHLRPLCCCRKMLEKQLFF